MDPWQAGAVFAAGVAAGTINAVVGSGTLITFPTLLAIGYPPVTANVSNNIGLVFGGVTGTWGYRRELEGQAPRLRRLVPMSLVGGVAGALLLLRLPPSAFAAIVPALILFSVVLVLVQPRLAVVVQKRRAQAGRPGDHVGVLAMAGTLLAGVYGGYFGAAQGVLLIGILGAVLDESLQRVNAAKNALHWSSTSSRRSPSSWCGPRPWTPRGRPHRRGLADRRRPGRPVRSRPVARRAARGGRARRASSPWSG